MSVLKDILMNLIMKLSFYYIEFVYKTSKLNITGNPDILDKNNEEKFIIGFWHGESYFYYPVFKDSKFYILTTVNKRGDYVSAIIEHFGYIPIRVPDEPDGNNHFFKILDKINGEEKRNLVLTLDGPLGPYHVPKKFAILTAKSSKRRIVLLSVKARRKINLLNRWDKYMIPLPFNKIEICVHDPIEVKKRGTKEISEEIVKIVDRRNYVI